MPEPDISYLKKVLLVSSGQPSLNPRLVKEADALAAAGFNVTVLYAYWNDWGTEYDKTLLATKKWHAIRVGGDPESRRFIYFVSRLIFKAANLFTRFTGSMALASIAVGRSSFFLIREAKRHPADLYIGHNLAALPAIVQAAKKYGKPCGFDAEDFHRYEVTDNDDQVTVKLSRHIEDRYFPELKYLTASSPLISQAYQQLYPDIPVTTILNVFPSQSNVLQEYQESERIKLFWFSQTIGINRGIEDIVQAMKLLNIDHFELHLLGNQSSTTDFIEWLKSSGIRLQLHAPVAPDDPVRFASQFDIGLALEPAINTNNNWALSNKIFTYLQAGLAVIASETAAQKLFLEDNRAIGGSYPIGNMPALTSLLTKLYHDRKMLSNCKQAALKLAKHKYNWEAEGSRFLNLVKQTLSA